MIVTFRIVDNCFFRKKKHSGSLHTSAAGLGIQTRVLENVSAEDLFSVCNLLFLCLIFLFSKRKGLCICHTPRAVVIVFLTIVWIKTLVLSVT